MEQYSQPLNFRKGEQDSLASLGHRSPVFQLPKVLLAGMNIAASPQLAAAVTNAGGLGVWGGVFYTPKMFRAKLKDGGLGCGDGHSFDRK